MYFATAHKAIRKMELEKSLEKDYVFLHIYSTPYLMLLHYW